MDGFGKDVLTIAGDEFTEEEMEAEASSRKGQWWPQMAHAFC